MLALSAINSESGCPFYRNHRNKVDSPVPTLTGWECAVRADFFPPKTDALADVRKTTG